MTASSSISLEILTLNVCGLCSKLKSIDFEEFCQKFNILCLTETKLDDLDVINIKNFKALPFLNRKNAKVKSGGVAVFVKNELFDLFVPLKGSSWFMLKENVVNSNFIFGVVYIPPERSSYSSIECFDIIENDIIDLVADKNNVKLCLLGDFNAHTNTLSDFINVDEHICDSLNLDVVSRNDLSKNVLEQFNISIDRYSQDKKKSGQLW